MRNQRHKLERIDIDELFSSPVNRGMLSFLERPPEEAQARLREKQKVNAIDASRLGSGSELLSGVEAQETTAFTFPSESTSLSQDRDLSSPQSHLGPVIEPVSIPIRFPTTDSLPVSEPALTDFLTPRSKLPSEQVPRAKADTSKSEQHENELFHVHKEGYPEGNLALGTSPARNVESNSTQGVTYLGSNSLNVLENSEGLTRFKRSRFLQEGKGKYSMGKSPPGVGTPIDTSQPAGTRMVRAKPEAETLTQPEVIDGSVIGRRQKVRRAVIAQDGHSAGEQLLYQALWNAGTPETPDTKLLSIGYSGMSALCKLEKSNCKKNVQGLIQKLAVQVTELHQSMNSTGTTYRVFSYKEILRRRENAGMRWVVRTSGVRFVAPPGNLPPAPLGELPVDPGGNLHSEPTGSLLVGAGGKLPTGPIGKTPTQIERNRKEQERLLPSASDNMNLLCLLARSKIAEFDDDACRVLWRKCKEVAPDCTLAEVVDCFKMKARQLFPDRVRRIANPVGLMIWSVPKMFEGSEALYLQRRRAKAEEEKQAAEAVAQFEQNRADWQARLNDPATSEEDRRFYRKLLGDPAEF